jgi:hypothetical protein
MGRRISLKDKDKRILEKVRRGHWSMAELTWLLTHLADDTPTLIVQEIHARLNQVQAGGNKETDE